MRHETCPTCRIPGADDPDVRRTILVAESIAPAAFIHHHHLVHCGGCGQWWFDDVVIGGLGIPVPARRDTELCACDENLPQYSRSAIHVPMPESECACTKADVDKYSLPVNIGRGGHYQAGRGHDRVPDRLDLGHAQPVPRAEAAHDISAHLDDQDAFIVSAPPRALAAATKALGNLRNSACYLDYGYPTVLRMRSPHLAEAAAMTTAQIPGTTCAVFVIPKSACPAKRLQGLLHDMADIPADGSQDVLLLDATGGKRMEFPVLLVEAFARSDPRFAAQLAANDLRSQS